MSLNPQTRISEKSEAQLRKPGRSGGGAQRGFSGGGGKGGGAAPPQLSSSKSSNQPALTANRSIKKSDNGQGGQSRSGSSELAPAPVAARLFQKGPSESLLVPNSGKSIDTSNQRSSRPAPRPPVSQPVAGSSDSAADVTPLKANASKSFGLQFGSISPGMMKGMQIPARTSSAPPNLDEQKRDQARHGSSRAIPNVPAPTVLKQQEQNNQHQLPGKDVNGAHQSNSVDSYPTTQVKRDMQLQPPAGHTAGPPRPPGLPVAGMPMPMPFQIQQMSVQFGNHGPQIQTQGVAPTSVQLPMTLPTGPQQMFVPSIQAHHLQQQQMLHQGQGLAFAPQMGHQLNPQMGNIGIGMAAGQYAQQQAGKFSTQRKTTHVKITHPETHQELKLDRRTDSHADGNSSGQRPHSNLTPQTQSIPSLTHPFAFYPTSTYNPSLFYSTSTSHPLSSTQMANSQPPRYNYTVAQGGQPVSSINHSVPTAVPGGKAAQAFNNSPESVNIAPVPSASSTVKVTVKPPSVPAKVKTPSVTISSPAARLEGSKSSKPHVNLPATILRNVNEMDPASSSQQTKLVSESSFTTSSPPVDQHAAAADSAVQNMQIGISSAGADGDSKMVEVDGNRGEPIRKSDSFKDQQKKPSRYDHKQSKQHQVNGSEPAAGSFTSPSKTSDESSSEEPGEDLSRKIESNSTTSSLSPSSESTTLCNTRELEALQNEIMVDKETSHDHVAPVDVFEQATGTGIVVDDTLPRHSPSPENNEVARKISATPFSNETQISSQNFKENSIVKPAVAEHQVTCDVFEDGTSSHLSPASLGSESSSGSSEVVFDQKEDNKFDKDKPVGPVLRSSKLEEFRSQEVVEENLVAEEEGELGKVSARTNGLPEGSSSDIGEGKLPPLGVTEEISRTSESQDVGLVSFDLKQAKAPLSASDTIQNVEEKDTEYSNVQHIPIMLSAAKEKSSIEPSRAKPSMKKKRKEMFSKADSAGNSDLYNAYKGPEENHEAANVAETDDTASVIKSNTACQSDSETNVGKNEEDGQSRAEVDDWEDAADLSAPKLRTVDAVAKVPGGKQPHDDGTNMKKYSKDFLLTLQEHCSALPPGFQIGPDIASVLMNASRYIADRDSYPNPGRSERSPGVSRGDRRMAGIGEDDKWTRTPASYAVGRDFRIDIGHGPGAANPRPGQGVNSGLLRNPRGQSSNQPVGGILSGPLQSVVPPGGLSRSSIDADRWQRASGIQRSVMPSPQSPLQIMHRTENKYEVGKVSDKEEAKQRQLKAILNKLTPQNFDKLFQQVKDIGIDNTITLNGVISQIFDKALLEPTFCEMYANFCCHLSNELPNFVEDNVSITFKRLLLNKCQEEFERGEREEEEASKAEEEGEIKQTEQEREKKRMKARRRMLGNIRLIGELFKKKMLTDRIMHECIKKLLGQYQNPDEENIEALCKLMSTIGQMIDQPKAKDHMEAYFDLMQKLSTNQKLSSRVRFMLKDAIDLRKNNWQQRRKVEGPKKIEEVHRDAALERQAQAGRLTRGSSIGGSSRRAPPVDYGSRGSSVLSSPTSQHMIGTRGLSPSVRGYTQDILMEDRPFERACSIPLPQRPSNNGSITLGPQGGLARGMSIRGQPSVSDPLLSEIPSISGQLRRIASGPNGYSSVQDRVSDQPNTHDHRASDRSTTNLHSPGRASSNASCDAKPLSEEQLREKSMLTIKEFYSAKDEDEVALCVKELNSPSFYPAMISLWVTDSFERKDKERDLLATLLVSLCKSRDRLLNQPQLLQGFESVLCTLEDAVNDAPRAAEFLGRIFARVIMEDVVPLREIGRLIHEGGEEPGRLLEAGLASDVLANILEVIKVEKGDSALNEIRTSSDLKLEDFRPPNRAKKLEKFR